MKAQPLWLAAVEVPKAAGTAFAALFEAIAPAHSCFEIAAGRGWRFETWLATEPARAALAARVALAAVAAGCPEPELTLAPLEGRDWLAESRRRFPPIAAGRFFVHGSYFEGAVPAGRIAIALDAGLAFGSGRHESTRGCLAAIERLARGRRFRRAIDLGCGSGILAVALAKLQHRPVAAADIDPVAVAVARANARSNGVAPLVRVWLSAGLRNRALGRAAAYDLIVANILARPLVAIAPALARALAPGGVVVLSGLLAEEERAVRARYRGAGLALRSRIALGSWVTLSFTAAGPRREAGIFAAAARRQTGWGVRPRPRARCR